MNTNTIQVGTVRTREDVAQLVLAIQAAELLESGAHLAPRTLELENNGREALASLSRKELRERAQPTLRVRGGVR